MPYDTTTLTQQHWGQSKTDCPVKMTSDLQLYGIALAQCQAIARFLVTYLISPTSSDYLHLIII